MTALSEDHTPAVCHGHFNHVSVGDYLGLLMLMLFSNTTNVAFCLSIMLIHDIPLTALERLAEGINAASVPHAAIRPNWNNILFM